MNTVPAAVSEGQVSKAESELPCTVCYARSRFGGGFDDIRLFRCTSCNHCFTDLSSLKEHEPYGSEYFDIVHKNWFQQSDTRLFDLIYSLAGGSKSHLSVLDIGCGKGNLLHYLRKRNPNLDLVGIDISPNSTSDGIEFIRGDFLTWTFNRRFDVVLSLQVIEHMLDPNIFAQRLLELSKEEGMVITNTINEQSLVYDVARFARSIRCTQIYRRLYSRHHINHFNLSSLRRLMERTGFKTEKHFRHRAPIAAMDIPAPNALVECVFRGGVWGTYVLGDLIGRSTYQTIACRK